MYSESILQKDNSHSIFPSFIFRFLEQIFIHIEEIYMKTQINNLIYTKFRGNHILYKY